MKRKSRVTKCIVCLLVLAMGLGVSCAARGVIKYNVHDMTRELPPVITASRQFGQPPADAIVLFDGTDLSEWVSDEKGGGPARWKVVKKITIPKRVGETDAAYRRRLLREADASRRAALAKLDADEITPYGYMEVVKKTGDIRTKRAFGNCQLHIEWATPEKVSPKEIGQKRGNSGVFFMGRYELQVLDSYENETYADGQAASIYGQSPPLVNVCREPGQWQSYDVSFLRPIFDKKGECIRPARITVFHNGVVVQNNVEIKGSTAHKKKAKYSPHADKLPLSLQDHNNPMRFRNIWIRELPEQPYLIKD
jgi:hypothetical protein